MKRMREGSSHVLPFLTTEQVMRARIGLAVNCRHRESRPGCLKQPRRRLHRTTRANMHVRHQALNRQPCRLGLVSRCWGVEVVVLSREHVVQLGYVRAQRLGTGFHRCNLLHEEGILLLVTLHPPRITCIT